MAAPTNLLELAQSRVTTWTAEKAGAQAAVTAAQSSLTDSLAALQAANAEFAAWGATIVALRARLALIETPADGAPLLQELEAAIIAQRGASADMLVQQRIADNARAASTSSRARLQDADAGLAAAEGALPAAQTAHAKREAARTAIAQPPLSALPARAASLLASQTFIDAEARIATDFPQALRDRSIARAALAIDEADRAATMRSDVRALVAAYHVSDGNAADKLAATWRALADAEAALYDQVAGAVSRVDAAEAALARIGSAENPPLSAEEHAAIDDAVALPGRQAAATAEDERDIAADAVDAAQARYDLEHLKVLAEDGEAGVTAALADATSDLAEASQELEDARAELTAAEAAYDNTMRETMQQWRAAVSDGAWRDLADFDAARRTLDELALSPAALGVAVTNAEAAVLAAELAVDEEAGRLRAYARALDMSEGVADAAAALLSRARFSALRGDA
jgi:trimeric autotransporter adhesin